MNLRLGSSYLLGKSAARMLKNNCVNMFGAKGCAHLLSPVFGGSARLRFSVAGCLLSFAPSVVAAQSTNVTNWATWTIPTEAEYEFALEETAFPGYFYAPGTTGSVVDPVTNETISLTLSGEVLNTSTDSSSWAPYPIGTSAYTSTESPTEITGAAMLAASGDTLEQYKAHTLSFGQDVENAVMPLWSLGQPGTVGELTFSQPFIVLSDNGLLTKEPDETEGYKISGEEGNGVIQFLGTYDEISWVVTGVEVWHGMSIGLTTPDNPEAGNTEIVSYDLFAEGTGVVAPTPFGTTAVTEDVRPGLSPTTSRLADQSLLERILTQVSGTTTSISGVFINSADNLGYRETVRLEDDFRMNIVLLEDDGAGNIAFTQAEAVFDASTGSWLNPVTGLAYNTVDTADDLVAGTPSVVLSFMVQEGEQLYADSVGNFYGYDPIALADAGFSTADGVNLDLDWRITDADTNPIIDASVTNIASQIEAVLASTSTAAASTAAEINIGNISTTALGAVNTGEILGSNDGSTISVTGASQELSESVDKVVTSTSTAISHKIVHAIRQPGSTADQFSPMINSALNTMVVQASVLNKMSGVNATIGRSGFETALSDATFNAVSVMNVESIAALTGGIKTTGLGAVNTGVIVSGVNTTVKGIVGIGG